MAQSREIIVAELNKLSKNALIDLLLLPQSEQKNDHLRNIKNQLDNLKNSAELSDNTLLCNGCRHVSKRIKIEQEENADESKTNDGMDNIVGVYMAYSIFHGYLNLVIPRTGTSEPHLQELMQDYEATQDIQFAVYKLFLLIPKSTHCPVSLEEASQRIQKCRPLTEKLITRAGVQQRSYKNSVYKIVDEANSSVYVVAEYATPVKTYKEVLTFNYGKDSETYKRNKDKVVEKFYSALQKILQEHESCTNHCELIFYEDKNENGSLRDLADVLMERIHKLKQD